MRRTLLFSISLLTLSATTTAAQEVWTGGYMGVGPAGVNNDLVGGGVSIAGGYTVHFGPWRGPQLGLRLTGGYAAYKPDLDAYLDSLNASEGSRDGGLTKMLDSGVDLVGGYRFGALGAYGFYGVHYYRDTREEMTLETDQGSHEFSFRTRTDFGREYGFGADFVVANGQGFYAEWFRGGGRDPRMLEADGWRFGMFWRR